MPPKNLFRHSQFPSDKSYFVLEQLAQRFDQFQIHLLRQTADIVMTLNHSRWTTHGNRLDHVRIKCALDKVTNVAQLSCLFFKDINEHFPDPFSLLFRISDTCKGRKKEISGANACDVQLHALAEQCKR